MPRLGWRTVRTLASQLLADAGLPAPLRTDGEISFTDNYYCTAVLGAPRCQKATAFYRG